MKRSLYLLSALFLVSTPVCSDDLEKTKPSKAGFDGDRLDRIDKMIQGCVDRNEVPGAVAILIRKGKIGYHKAFGWADIESKKPLEKDALFRIASMSKLITTVGALQLFEHGRYGMFTPLGSILPEFSEPKVFQSWNKDEQKFVTEPAKNKIRMNQLFFKNTQRK